MKNNLPFEFIGVIQLKNNGTSLAGNVFVCVERGVSQMAVLGLCLENLWEKHDRQTIKQLREEISVCIICCLEKFVGIALP